MLVGSCYAVQRGLCWSAARRTKAAAASTGKQARRNRGWPVAQFFKTANPKDALLLPQQTKRSDNISEGLNTPSLGREGRTIQLR